MTQEGASKHTQHQGASKGRETHRNQFKPTSFNSSQKLVYIFIIIFYALKNLHSAV